MKTLNKIKHPTPKQAIIGGIATFAVAVVLAIILSLYDSGIESLIGLIVH